MSEPIREAFEQWCREKCSPGAESSEWYWQIWRDAYALGARTMREQCAKECETQAYVHECADDMMAGVVRGRPYRNLATTIRALQVNT